MAKRLGGWIFCRADDGHSNAIPCPNCTRFEHFSDGQALADQAAIQAAHGKSFACG